MLSIKDKNMKYGVILFVDFIFIFFMIRHAYLSYTWSVYCLNFLEIQPFDIFNVCWNLGYYIQYLRIHFIICFPESIFEIGLCLCFVFYVCHTCYVFYILCFTQCFSFEGFLIEVRNMYTCSCAEFTCWSWFIRPISCWELKKSKIW